MNKVELEFASQVERTLARDVNEFKNNPDYSNIKEIYKDNFFQIASLINKFGAKGSIEDISKIDTRLTRIIIENLLFLQQINIAISKGKLSANNL